MPVLPRVRQLLSPLYFVPDRPRSYAEIFLWWEQRRPIYNLIVAVCAFVPLVMTGIRLSPPWIDFDLPLLWLIALFYIFPSNFWYTGGWIAEMIVSRFWRDEVRDFGPILFAMGLA